MFYQNPDLICGSNNGVLAIAPTKSGRLARLVKKTKAGRERVWTFSKPHVWEDEDGDERIDHKDRGALTGNSADGQAFLMLCYDLGIRANYSGLYVPFSNGMRRYGRFEEDDKPTNDYTESELKLARWDLPTRQQLEDILKPA
ncbi:MAG: hypothetical protein V1895_03995 [Parcubacteria group bacterium]